MTARTLHLMLSLPPSLNNAYTGGADGRRHLVKAARDWKTSACETIGAEMIAQRCQPFDGQSKIAIRLSERELVQDRDCDNAVKLLLDAFVKAKCLPNDHHRHLRAISVEWCSDLAPDTCEVIVSEIAVSPVPKPAATSKLRARTNEVPASIMRALRARGIHVAPERIRVQ